MDPKIQSGLVFPDKQGIIRENLALKRSSQRRDAPEALI
jgi:hypothetical protein